jgi:type III secretory pathway component EscR
VREIMNEANHNILFMQLVIQNQQIAMMAMGKIKNPVTDKIERNLEHAKIYIDSLDMLMAKTKGNLSEYEEKFLTETLKELKLNYVDEVDKDKKQEKDVKKEAQESKEEEKK